MTKKALPVQVHIPFKKLMSELDSIIEARINPEIYLDGTYLSKVNTSELDEIKKRLDEFNLKVTMHGPYMGTNPGSPNDLKRIKTVEIYRSALDVASRLLPVNMVLHAGYDEERYNHDVEWWLEQSMKTWREIVKEAEDIGVTIAVENIFEKYPLPLRLLSESVGSTNFGICLDTGHLNLFSEIPLEEWFVSIKEHVKEVHIHDNNGSRDEHLAIGEGNIDFDRLFQTIKENSPEAILTVEPHGDDAILRALAAIEKYL